MLEMLLITKGQGHKIPGKPLMKIPRKATFSTTLAFYYCRPINSTAEMKLNSERRRQNFEFLCIFSFWPFKFNPEQILVFKAKSNWSSLMPKWAFDVNCQGHVLTFRKDELCWDFPSDWIGRRKLDERKSFSNPSIDHEKKKWLPQCLKSIKNVSFYKILLLPNFENLKNFEK